MPPQTGINSNEENSVDENDVSLEFGKFLAHPEAGEEIVISGLSGAYPNSENVHQFRDNLYNKVDMVSGDDRRWAPGHPEIPQRTGKVFNIEKFDAGYFGVHHRQAHCSDPMARMVMERAIEAIFDAGLHPSDLEGTNTGVFIGSCFSESEKTWFYDKLVPQGSAVTGCQRNMQAQRTSYFLKLKGPSFVCDTACSSSLYAFEHAYKAIRSGQCDRAIVCGANICLHPFVSLQFARLGVLSMDGTCKVFDQDGNGYVRSEAISACILQKSKEAKRIYSTVLHARTNCDGYKDSGITYPSGEMQIRLLKEFYEECDQVKPTELSFLEAHGTGTKVGDPEELQAVEEVFLKGRKTPLPIGSVKSNIGHTEPSSGMCSITKAIIAFENGYIPPNIHYNKPRPSIPPLVDGRLKVVTEKMPFNDDRGLIGINSFGFGGGNCHVLLKHNPKQKINQGRPKDNIPRLVCVSGRTKDAILSLLDDVMENNVDAEQIRLMQDVFRKNIKGHNYRGYTLASKAGEISRSFSFNARKFPRLVLCFGVMDEWSCVKIRELLEVPLVVKSVQRIHEVLSTKDVNITEILSKSQTTVLEKVLVNFSLQIIFADIIRALEIVPDQVFGISKGLSLGTLICAYFDDAISLKEAVDCAFAIGYAANFMSANDGTDSKELNVLVEKSGKIATQLQQNLTKILAKPRRLSKKVIFDVTPAEISSIYLTNSLGSTKVLSYVKTSLMRNFAIFEVGNGTINETLRKDYGQMSSKFFVGTNSGVNEFLISIGRLYELGFNPQMQKFYPKVEFPVSRGTPMISPNIKWSHGQKWWVTHYQCEDQMKIEERSMGIVLLDPGYSFLSGHVIDGRTLFPATGYLLLVWETVAHVHGLMTSDMKVIFENCKFKRACAVPKETHKLDLVVMVQRGTGNFEVVEGGLPVVTGRITQATNNETDPAPIPLPTQELQAVSLSTKDIYKELRLRGYNYKGQFRGLSSCDVGAEVAKITWDSNWVTFMDTMLQMKILQEDTRLLYVPTTIQRLTIDAKKHIEYAQSFGVEKPSLPVYAPKDSGIIRSGAIEIRGLNASSIPRRKYLGTPVLEKYIFVPNIAKLRTEQAVRVNMQILLENLYSTKVKAVELIDEATSTDLAPLGELIHDVLADQPLIHPDITILSKNELELKNVKVEDKKLLTEIDCSLVVGSKILQRKEVLHIVFGSVKENGFMMSREPLDFDISNCANQGITVVTVFTTDKENLIFFRKQKEFKTSAVIKITSTDKEFNWLPNLKNAMDKNKEVLVYAQGESLNGILGLVNCIRREPGAQTVKLAFIVDPDTPDFDLSHPFYIEQLKKNLALNVFKSGQWGTYRHLLLDQYDQIDVEHCYLNSLVRGDLSTLKWIEGPLSTTSRLKMDHELVSIYYAAINFRDVMTASGRINVDAITRDRREQECVQGFEFSGRTQSGKRVMGMVVNGACASLVAADKNLFWEVPNDWSLADAATVPVVYATSMYSLFRRGRMQRGDSVLIHSGTGGVGQAAITLALFVGCTVYTTVGTPEKREFLKKKFPQLTDKNIANSRDTSFENHIMKITNGRGVDIVLNSLAEEKLLASVRCLAKGGRFVEIGKFDLASDNPLNLLLIEKDASFHGLMLDALFDEAFWTKSELFNIVQEGIDSGAIKPLNKTVFSMNQPEEVFRYMGSGKHTGKVLIQVRQEEKDRNARPQPTKFSSLPRYYCDENKTYIICGGLGGFGLELADWLVLRGCRKLVLTSRTGIKTGYQAYRISVWKSYGCLVQVSTENITTLEGCQKLIENSNKLGPVHAIFNLAVVLKDALLENQTEEAYKVSFGPKAYATEYLDLVTRKLCPELRDFVIFSSVSCGRGNAGQSNYGMSNSVMERICEKRRNEGYPALAIEWGAVGDVGLVADMQDEAIEMEIGGTLQQRISNCLQCMDMFLRQNESAVVSSIVVAEKRSGAGGADNIVDAVANILGVKDLKCISLQATLAEVGMDSMTAVEIKQTLEREFEVFLTPPDIKTMTFAKLIEIQAEMDAEKLSGTKKERALVGMDMVLRLMGDETNANVPVLPIKGKMSDKPSLKTVILFPGIEGVVTVLEPLYKSIEANLVGLQFPHDTQKDTIEDMASTYVQTIERYLSKSEPFNIVCYSYGGIIALEAAHQLEQKGYKGTVICIDSSPDYLMSLTKVLEVSSDDKFQVSLLVQLMSLQISYDVIAKHLEAMLKCGDFEARMNLAEKIVGKDAIHAPEFTRSIAVCVYKRLKALVNWTPEFKLKSKVILYKPTLVSINLPGEDYGLFKVCEQPVEVQTFDGNHVTILENPKVAAAINTELELVEDEIPKKGQGDLLINVDKVQIEELAKVK